MKYKSFFYKFLFIFFVLTFFSFLKFNNVSQATSVSCNDLTFTVPDDVDNFLIGTYQSGGYLLLVPKSDSAVFKITGYNEGIKYTVHCYTDNTFTNYCSYDSYYLSSGTDFTSKSCSLTSNVNGVNRTFNTSNPFLYSNFNVYGLDGSIFYAKTSNMLFNIELSTNDKTIGPLIVYSNYFNYSDVDTYKVYISSDANSWNLMNYETFNDTINNNIKFRFNYKIYANGCYYFKLLDTKTNTESLLSCNISNIIKDENNSGFINGSGLISGSNGGSSRNSSSLLYL